MNLRARSGARTWIAYLTLVASWGSSYLFIRLAVDSFTPVGMVLTRFSVAAGLCAFLSMLGGERWPTGRAALRFALVGVLMMSGSNALTAFAQQSVSSGIAGVVHSLSALWMAALGALGAFGPQVARTPPRAFVGVAFGVLGVALLLWPEGEARAQGVGVAALLLSTVLFAGASVLQRRTQQTAQVGLFAQLTVQMLGGAAAAGLMSLHFGVLHAPLTGSAVAAIAVLTVFPSVLGFAGYAVVLHDWPPARAGSYAVINPVVAVLLGVVVLGEPLSLRSAVGAAITLAGVAWVQWVTSRR